jgi:hypothetical protein
MTKQGQRLLALVTGLTEATIAGRARWQRTDRAGTYVFASPAGAVTISGPTGRDAGLYRNLIALAAFGSDDYTLAVSDARGNEVESVRLRNYSPSTPDPVIAEVSGRITSKESVELRRAVHYLFELMPVADEKADQVTEGILDDLGLDDS